jgi:hypothetical protein
VTNSNFYNCTICIILIGGSYAVFLSYLFSIVVVKFGFQCTYYSLMIIWYNFQVWLGLSEHVYGVCIVSNEFVKLYLTFCLGKSGYKSWGKR